MKRFLTSLMGRLSRGENTNPRRRPATRARLGVEALDDRCLLSVTAFYANDTLFINDSDDGQQDNVVEVVDRLNWVDMEIRVNGTRIPVRHPNGGSSPNLRSFTFDPETARLAVNLNGGNDRFTFRLGGGRDTFHSNSNVGNPKTFDVDLGGGAGNHAIFDFVDNSSGVSRVAKIRQQMTINVYGGNTGENGSDNVYLELGEIQQRVHVNAYLGDGTDYFMAHLYGPITPQVLNGQTLAHGNLNLVAYGNFGQDYLTAHNLGDVSHTIAAGCSLDVRFDGNAGADTIDVDLWYNLHGSLKVNATGGYGGQTDNAIDSTTVHLTASAWSTGGRIDAQLWEGNANERDYQELFLYNHAANFGVVSTGLVDGGDGYDTARTQGNVTWRNIEWNADFVVWAEVLNGRR